MNVSIDNIGIVQDYKVSRYRLVEFCQDSLRKVSLPYLAWLMVALVMVFAAYFPWRGSPLASIRPALLSYYLILSVHVVHRLKAGGRANVLAPDILFLFFYTMFHLGYVTLYGINIIPYVQGIFIFRDSIPRAMLVVNLGLVGFLFGYELMGPKSTSSVIQERLKLPTRNWCIFGLAVMTIALAMHLIALSLIGPSTLARYGYGAIQNARKYVSPAVAMMLSQSNPLMLFGMTIHLVSSALKYGKLFHSKIALGLVITFIAIYIMEGDRGPVLWLGIPMLLVRHYFIKRIKVRYLIIMVVAAMILFAGLAIVRKTVFAPVEMWQEYQYQKSAGVLKWWNPLVEMGGSFKVVNITTQNVPSVTPYWKGKSYISAALHTIPFLEGFFTRRGWLGEFGYWPSKWVTITYFGTGYAGQAFTVAAEGYLNFGFLGVFFELMLFGLFVRWVMVRFSKKPSAAWAFIMLGFLGASVVVIRNHLQLITGLCFQISVIAAFISMFCGNESELEPEQFETSEDLAGQLYAEYDKLQYE